MSLAPKYIVDRINAMERVELVRLASKKTKGAFAASLGMYPPNYSKLIRGEFFLTTDQIYTIYRLYGADPKYIMDGRMDGMSDELLERINAFAEQG